MPGNPVTGIPAIHCLTDPADPAEAGTTVITPDTAVIITIVPVIAMVEVPMTAGIPAATGVLMTAGIPAVPTGIPTGNLLSKKGGKKDTLF